MATARSAVKRIPWRGKAWNAHFSWIDSKGNELAAHGRKFVIDGVSIELYPSGALCHVLERNRKTLYGWEMTFNFPQALWRVRDMKTVNRWYSRSQLIAVLTVMKAFGYLRGKNRARLSPFIEAVRKVFYSVDSPTVQRNLS